MSKISRPFRIIADWLRESDVVPGRLELPTSTLSVWRSNQLSYRTGFKLSAYVPELSFIFLYI